MLKLHFAGPESHPFSAAVDLVGSTRSIGATIDALRSDDLDALLFPSDWAHPMKSVRASLPADAPSFIAVHEQTTRASLVHALACGFDGVVATSEDRDSVVDRIERIIDGSWTFESEPWLRDLGLTRGLLARELLLDDDGDEELVDLMGTGLPDEDIALLMEWTIQRVRNRIANLLSNNDLSYRTQLAVIRAASVKVADFS